ncbi:Beta-lactamase [Saliniradius amylolyticus]|uniref:Beta-lactamase n=1 Tax=Saliniradius amylolyticus TaxID=2183582 RepID=A0A2S2E0C9_9ALTE|nr:alpha/beta hydrolase-fold protein [Saliniradius amylolyticus]AWL11073.1 Beta-lactamase [Saliniradius amylolyticus]
MKLILWLVVILLVGCNEESPKATKTSASTISGDVRVFDKVLTLSKTGQAKTLRVYLPPGYDASDKHYPVLYMHDGQNLFDKATAYIEEWQVDEQLNRLAQSGEMGLIVVGIDHAGPDRINELSPWEHAEHGKGWGEAYTDFIVHQVKPWVDSQFRTRAQAESTAIMGSSLGGLATQYAIHQYPEVFSKAAVFSPSFWYAPAVFAHAQVHPLTDRHRVYYLAGGEEGGDIPALTEKMARQQRQVTSVVLETKIVPGGEHNEALWRTHFTEAVLWLFK